MWTETDVHTEKMPWEDAGKGWGDASTSHGTAEAASAPSEHRERQGTDCPSGSPAGSSQHLMLNFCPPDLGDNTFLLILWPSPSKEMHPQCTHFNLFVLITDIHAAGLTLSLQATASARVFSLSPTLKVGKW